MISYYELLKKVEEGDIPEKIKVHLTSKPRVYTADYDGSSFSHYFIDGDTDEEYHHYLSECFLESDMFDKNIEIIEEEKKIPEKIEYYHQYDECVIKDKFYKDQKGSLVDEIIIDKLNEVLDYLNSKGE